MNTAKKLTYISAGFVGGVAFLISCGGGSGGGDSGGGINSSFANPVPSKQMVCDRFGGSGNHSLTDRFTCFDTDGKTFNDLSLKKIFDKGWKIQQLGGDTVFIR